MCILPYVKKRSASFWCAGCKDRANLENSHSQSECFKMSSHAWRTSPFRLQLHKAVLEPLHGQLENGLHSSDQALLSATQSVLLVPQGGDHRFPGRAYYLGLALNPTSTRLASSIVTLLKHFRPKQDTNVESLWLLSSQRLRLCIPESEQFG